MMQRYQYWLIIAGIYGAMGVAMGAWAAHGPSAGSTRQYWADMGSRHQLLHAAALIGVCALDVDRPAARWALAACRILFTLGAAAFCGTLYMLAAGFDAPFSGSAPLGGSMLILGWLHLAAAGVFSLRRNG